MRKSKRGHRKRLEIAQGLGDRGGVGKAHANLGNTSNSNGQYEKAIECHRKDLKIAAEMEEKGGVGRAQANLRNTYKSIGQYQKQLNVIANV